MKGPPEYGLMARFETPSEILDAARLARSAGFTVMDAFSPFPVEGLVEAIGVRPTRIPLMVLAGGIAGCIGGFFLQYYAAVISYPLNVGGRPLNSWPSFIPITFELTVLFAGITAVVSMLFRNGLPRPYHPVFNVEEFDQVTRDKFFLCIEATDPLYDRTQTHEFLATLHPSGIFTVEH